MVYVIQCEGLSDSQRGLILSLQGVVNRREPRIFLDVDVYMQYLTLPYKVISVEEAMGMFAKELKGYIRYSLSPNDVAVNMAATLSACYDVIGVPYGLEPMAEEVGLTCLFDLGEVKGTPTERQRQVFLHCKDKLHRDGLVHQVVRPDSFYLCLRDLSIARGWACIYTEETEEGRAFLREVLSFLDSNIAVLGWTDDELLFVEDLSVYGDYVIPMDWSCNHSFWRENPHANVKQKNQPGEVRPNKHYLAIVVSDGDNIQWLERDFSTTSTFGQRLQSPMNYKMNFTVSPSLIKQVPEVAQKLYGMVKNDRFLSGVSGIGYCNCLKYPYNELKIFGEMTAKQMKKADLPCICLLDNIRLMKEDYRRRLDCFADHEEIMGGVWELDPDRYVSGNGNIYWSSNGKPFVSVRFTFWPKEGDKSLICEEWIASYARKINAMPVAPDRAEGYSVLNVNPWTVKVEHIDQLVSLLGEQVEILYIDEMIGLVRENIKEKQSVL